MTSNWNTDDLNQGRDADVDIELESTDDDVLVEETTPEPEPVDQPATKRKTRRAPSSDRFTRSQVATVLDTHDDVKAASAQALTILRGVLRDEDADAQALTGLILTADRSDNPLATLSSLLDALEDNPFAAAARIAGMPVADRNRAFAAMQAATGATETLSKKDVEAATTFAGALSQLTDDQRLALDEAHELLGK